jgi:hypothetical protein
MNWGKQDKDQMSRSRHEDDGLSQIRAIYYLKKISISSSNQ